MLTRNYRQLSLSKLMNDQFYIKLSDGSETKTINSNINPVISGANNGNLGMSIRIGSGGALPSFDDYCLESPIGIIPSIISVVKDKSLSNAIGSVVAVFVNNTDSEISVSESVLTISASGMTAETKYYVVAREVFDPIVVPAGSSVTITMTIS